MAKKPRYRHFAFFSLLVVAFLASGLLAQEDKAFAQETPTNNGRTVDVYTKKATKSFSKRKYKRSVKQFNKALKLLEAQTGLMGSAETERLSKIALLKEKFALAQYHRGLRLSQKSSYGKSISHLNKAIRFDSKLRVAKLARGVALTEKDEDTQAQNDFASLYDFTNEGTASSLQTANTAIQGLTIIYTMTHHLAAPTGTDPIATIDTGAKANAWSAGWTGRGVKVGIVDDFRSYEINGQNTPSHGHRVAFIALSVAPDITLNQRQVNLGVSVCSPRVSISTNEEIKASAKEYAEHYRALSKGESHIINQSFAWQRTQCNKGRSYVWTDDEWAEVSDIFAKYEISIHSSTLEAGRENGLSQNLLFVKSGGNYGNDRCSRAYGKGTEKCNLRAAALLKLRETNPEAGDRIIFVGALKDDDSDPNTQDVMADYSNIAGALKNDFIVAHDDLVDAGEGLGTSFAAPRVTGAAALVRHKFPNLNGAELKQVLLQTATGLGKCASIDPSTHCADETFGHGELNILNALSPVGKVKILPQARQYDFTTGTASTASAANTAVQIYITSYTTLSPSSLPVPTNPIATVDTGAKTNAWSAGWTGKGVKVAVMDDFDLANNRLHGTYVATIVATIAPEIDLNQYRLVFGSPNCAPTHRKPTPQGVTSFAKTYKTRYDALSRTGYFIINQSFGLSRYQCTGGTDRTLLSEQDWEGLTNAYAVHELSIQPSSEVSSLHRNMLFVKSAGNDGASCKAEQTVQSSATEKCSLRSAALLKLSETKSDAGDRIIFAGSLKDDDGDATTADVMADYSNTAGALKDHFIVAHDDVFRAGDGAGTSYAAPRVTGAAALVRHKFPNLDGAALKQVLLQTATGLGSCANVALSTHCTDETFGHGELNILNALSPVGTVTVK